jgi:hypothetical protein
MISEKAKGLLEDQGTYNVLTNVKQLPSKKTILRISSQRMNNSSSSRNWDGCFDGLLKQNYNIRAELQHSMSFRLQGGAPMYVCTKQHSGQWLIKATDNYRLESRVRLKAWVL